MRNFTMFKSVVTAGARYARKVTDTAATKTVTPAATATVDKNLANDNKKLSCNPYLYQFSTDETRRQNTQENKQPQRDENTGPHV